MLPRLLFNTVERRLTHVLHRELHCELSHQLRRPWCCFSWLSTSGSYSAASKRSLFNQTAVVQLNRILSLPCKEGLVQSLCPQPCVHKWLYSFIVKSSYPNRCVLPRLMSCRVRLDYVVARIGRNVGGREVPYSNFTWTVWIWLRSMKIFCFYTIFLQNCLPWKKSEFWEHMCESNSEKYRQFRTRNLPHQRLLL